MERQEAVRTMLEARSIAIVGASPRKDSFGEMMLIEARRSGFDGAIYPVNPKYDEIMGLPAFKSIADVPESVDLAVLGVGNHLLETSLQQAADAGAKSAAIFASGYTESEPGQPPLIERLATIARENEMAVCGGNCMGFLNVDHKVRICGYVEPDLAPGPITFISHSGSVFSAVAYNDRDLRFNLIVSAGQEYATTTADYMLYALEQQTTKAIGLFIETIRDPDRFVQALNIAAERDVPVIALKVGREAMAREMVAAHSGALAGEDGAYEALFEKYGVLRVENLERMCDTLELFTRNGRRAGPGGLASIHDSGGERAMFVDAAAEADVPFAQINEATTARLAETLEEGLPPVNPLDAWGTNDEATRVFTDCIRILHDDPDTAAFAFAVDMTYDHGNDEDYVFLAKQVWPDITKPFAMLSNMSSTIHSPDAQELRDAGIPVLEGTNTGLLAFRHLFEYRDFLALPPLADVSLPNAEIRERWRTRLQTGESISESEGLQLLRDYGVPVIESVEATTLEEALAAAEKVSYPVAMKTAVPGIQHKSDAGGVRLGLDGEDDLREAYEDLATRLGTQVVVMPMAPKGVELALGIVRDPQFGPLVLVGAGGIFVELLKDRKLGIPPLDEPRAKRMVDGLATRPILDGARGAPASDVAAVVSAVVAMSVLAHDLGDHLDALDANPLIAHAGGCVAVDALVIPRSG